MTVWHPLERGEPVGVIALSGPVDPLRLAAGMSVLQSWGHPVETASNLDLRTGYLAGSDDARLDGVQDLLGRGIRTFFAARGGYGVTRLLPRLPWRSLIAAEAMFVGFSDLTALLNPLASSVVQVHGPMVASGLSRPENAERLRRLLRGRLCDRVLFRLPSRVVLRHGRAEGPVIGGNLSVLASLFGTPWEPDLSDRVLFLEEVSEPAYRLDRLLTQLRSSTGFGRVKALICGTLHGCRPQAACAERWAELLLEATTDGVPVVFGLPFGHGARNMAFPVGARVLVDTRKGAISWST